MECFFTGQRILTQGSMKEPAISELLEVCLLVGRPVNTSRDAMQSWFRALIYIILNLVRLILLSIDPSLSSLISKASVHPIR